MTTAGAPKEPKLRAVTHTGYAVYNPNPLYDQIIQIRPSQDAPEGMAVFDTYNNAKWFADFFKIPESAIHPVVIVRTDGHKEMVE